MSTAHGDAHAGAAHIPVAQPRDFTWESADGLRLYGRNWIVDAADGDTRIPVICLPGLSRNSRDFNDIAGYLHARNHHVVALDYRGRGKSDWDSDWRNYALPVEENDISLAIENLGLKRFAVLGTSRGGLHALIMAGCYAAEQMAGVIFNDVGPHIEMRAIHRIAATLGHRMNAGSLEQVADNLKHTIGNQFPAFESKDWLKLAGQLASKSTDGFVMDYDPALARQFASLDDAAPAPDLWPLYDRLLDRPVMVIHGEKSDLLSPETCKRMVDTHPNARLKTIPGQGHAPVLWETDTHEAVARFLQEL